MATCPSSNFCLLWHWHIMFDAWVYHYKMMLRVLSWSRYVIDLWPQYEIYLVFNMVPCLSHSFFVLRNSHTVFGYINFIFTMNLCLGWSTLLFAIGLPNLAHVCITMTQHVVYIYNLCMTLTFDLKVDIGIWCRLSSFSVWVSLRKTRLLQSAK